MPSPGELYIAHFLGPQGAEKMFNAGLDNPDQIAAKLFPQQAKANPQIFYDDGHARTIREVYKALVAKHDGIVAAPRARAPTRSSPRSSWRSRRRRASRWPTDATCRRASRKADMSFTALFATETPTGTPTPLIGAEAAAPLIAAARRHAADRARRAPVAAGADAAIDRRAEPLSRDRRRHAGPRRRPRRLATLPRLGFAPTAGADRR